MTKDPTKNQSATVVADPSLEEKIRLRAYALYEDVAGKTVTMSMTGSAQRPS